MPEHEVLFETHVRVAHASAIPASWAVTDFKGDVIPVHVEIVKIDICFEKDFKGCGTSQHVSNIKRTGVGA